MIWVVSLMALLGIFACGTKKESPPKPLEKPGPSIHWEEFGQGDTTLLLVHGWSNTLHVWDEHIERLSKKYRVVALDLPGFGQSKNSRGQWSMPSFGLDVAELISYLGLDHVVLVGFSMGGPVCLEAARHVPDKVLGIVLVDVLHNLEYQYSSNAIETLTGQYMAMVTDPRPDAVASMFKTRSPELTKRYLAMVEGMPKAGWKDSFENYLHWMNTKAQTTVKTLTVPIYSINSDQYPTEAAIFRKYSPLYKVRIIQGVNHVVFWEAPHRFENYLNEFIHDFKMLCEPLSVAR